MSISGSIANLAPRENFPEVGTFPPPIRNLDEINGNKEMEKLMDTMESNNKLMCDVRDLLQDILLEIKVLRISVQNDKH